MKILQICCKAPYPADDGGSIGIYNMINGFLACGVDTHVLTMNTSKHFKPDENVPDDFKKRTHYQSVNINNDITIFKAVKNLFSKWPFQASRFIDGDFEKAIISILEKNTFDIIQLEGLYISPYITTIKKYSKAKIALRTFNVEHIIWDRKIEVEKNSLKKFYFKLQNTRLKKFESYWSKQADVTVHMTQDDDNIFEKLGMNPKNHLVVPIGMDLDTYVIKTNIPKEKYSVFHLGMMDWMPNIEAVLWFLEHVWDHVLNLLPEAKFYIAGRRMSDKIKSINKPNVIIVGEVDNHLDFIQSKQVMVVPLLSGSGMRVKILEGLSMGANIVSTSIGAEGIQVENNKNIRIEDESKAFAAAIVEILKNEALSKVLSSHSRQLIADKYSIKAVTESLVHYYEKQILN
jgi:polysaccharide biosynthesis protein PslH